MFKCKFSQDGYCRKYAMHTYVCCPSCHEPDFETDPAKQ